MKKKQFSKKLTLKKLVVTNLSQVKGGRVVKTDIYPIELSTPVQVICATEYEVCKPPSQFCSNGYNFCEQSVDIVCVP